MDDNKSPSDVADGLFSRNGVAVEEVTPQMLKTFERETANAMRRDGQLKSNHGITPSRILKLSRAEDIERANRDIHYAVPMSIMGWVMTIRAQASPLYGETSHEVKVEFLEAANVSLSDIKDLKPLQIAKQITCGRVKFDCDCGRHRFWYRYIATVGRWAYGHGESRFPRVRNKTLRGVACKHVVRVAKELQSSRAFHNMVIGSVKRLGLKVEKTEAEASKLSKRMIELRKEIVKPKAVPKSKQKASIKDRKPLSEGEIAKLVKAFERDLRAGKITAEKARKN